MAGKSHILAVFCLGLFLFGCTAQQPAAGNETQVIKYVCANGQVVTETALCPNITTGGAAQARELTKEEQLSVCTGMPESQQGSLEDMCVIGLAAKIKDASLCQELSRDSRPGCYALVASAKNDVNVCAEAGTYKDRCYEEYARISQDASACDKISDINSKGNCYYNLFNVLGDPALCDKIASVGTKDSCYWSAAMRTGDSTYCNKITNANQKENCNQNLASQGGQSVPK